MHAPVSKDKNTAAVPCRELQWRRSSSNALRAKSDSKMLIFFGSGDSCGKNPQQIQHAMLQQNAPRRETPGSPSRPLGLPHPSWQRVLPELVSSLPRAGPYRMPRNPRCARDLVQGRGRCSGWGHCLASRPAPSSPGWNLRCSSGSAFPSLLAQQKEAGHAM